MCGIREAQTPHALRQGILRFGLRPFHGTGRSLCICTSAAKFFDWGLIFATGVAPRVSVTNRGTTTRSPRLGGRQGSAGGDLGFGPGRIQSKAILAALPSSELVPAFLPYAVGPFASATTLPGGSFGLLSEPLKFDELQKLELTHLARRVRHKLQPPNTPNPFPGSFRALVLTSTGSNIAARPYRLFALRLPAQCSFPPLPLQAKAS
eukprot:symbB.v1.2.031548.t1/scaffold3671.1/size64718/8